MIRFLSYALMLTCLAAGSASAHMIDGFLAQCSAVGAGTCTEFAMSGYLRQPIYFNSATKGVAKIGTTYTFPAVAGTMAGRAIYDQPTGGNLLMVMPLATPVVLGSTKDTGDVASIVLTITALAPYQYSAAYSGTFLAAAVLGTDTDGSVLTGGVALTIARGELRATSVSP
jgi:hypothetical protein